MGVRRAAIVAVATTLLAAGCGGQADVNRNDPVSVTRGWARALVQGDPGTACELMSARFVNDFGGAPPRSTCRRHVLVRLDELSGKDFARLKHVLGESLAVRHGRDRSLWIAGQGGYAVARMVRGSSGWVLDDALLH
jgi:hypothetical protein